MFCVAQVPSHIMMGLENQRKEAPPLQQPVSPMGEACSRMDLTAIHQILVMTHYRDDEVTNEVFMYVLTRKTILIAFGNTMLKKIVLVYRE